MQLKNGFHLITNTSVLASVPNHNNNQPFSGVNLVVNEAPPLPGDNEGGITVYSLYENGLGEGMMDETPEGTENLNFTPNEFGFLELISSDEEEDDEDDDFSTIPCNGYHDDHDHDEPSRNGSELPLSSCNSIKLEVNEDEDDEMKIEPMETSDNDDDGDEDDDDTVVSCVTCGCFGLLGEFHDDKHCTYDCALITRITTAKKKLEEERLKFEEQMQQQQSDQVGRGAPIELFRHPAFPGKSNPFCVNDLLEAIDPEHQCFFCPVRVVETLGYRLLVKFIGFPDKYNFWVNADSQDIFPVNWTNTYTRHQLHFHAPPNFSWQEYCMEHPDHRVSPDENFPHIYELLSRQESLVKVGMKLEAVDIRNKNLVCVATVSCVMGNRFLIHFDSWDSLYDYWTTLDSAWVHPVGYCKLHGIEITPPHCYETASEFDWDEYLKKTGSLPVPKELFNPLPPVGFQVGQELEVIDKRSPRLLRVGTVSSVTNYTLTITILNDPQYNFELNDRSPDLHPLNWHVVTNHPLDSDILPLENACPNHPVCRSACSVRGPEFSTHSKSRDCPYSLANLNEMITLTDRVVIFEDKYYDLGGGGIVQQQQEEEDEEEEHDNNKEQERPIVVVQQPPPSLPPPPPQQQQQQQQPGSVLKRVVSVVDKPPNKQPLLSPRNSLLPTPINFSSQTKSPPHIPKRSEILNWDDDKVSDLVQSLCSNLPTAQKVADQFRKHLIDGESFLMLTQSDMTDALGIKLGPAVKIYNLIRLIDLNK